MHVAGSIMLSLLKQLLDLVYPPICHICERRLEEGDHLCQTCLENFKFENSPLTKFSISTHIYINDAWALFEFDTAFQKLIHGLKYAGKRRPVITVLDYYADEVVSIFNNREYDWVIPVPLHARKQRERGYNQVDQICDWLADKIKSRVHKKLIKRVKYTKSQTKLSAEEREVNMGQAFQVSAHDSVKHTRILIVDDVITTGATANSIAHVLKRAGAKKIDLISLSSPK